MAPRWLTRGLIVLVGLAAACTDSPTGPGSPPPQDAWLVIGLVSGGGQPGAEGSRLADPIIVQVTDEKEDLRAGVPLRFSVIHGGGLLSADRVPQRTVDVTTDARGQARVEWTLGSLPEHILKVSVPEIVNGAPTRVAAAPRYVFGGMEAAMSTGWTRGYEFNTPRGGLRHDDRILETPHFLTFSDGSGDDAKVVFAAMAEESLHEIMEAFGVPDPGTLGFDASDPATKLTIFSNHTLEEQEVAYSFRFGFYAAGRDTGVYPSLAILRQVVKHELTHVFRMLVDYRWAGPEHQGSPWYLETWFEEGIAEHTAGGSWEPIRTQADLDAWRAQPDHTNPVAIHDWWYFPESVIERSNGFEYYPMFDLAVRYLLDDAGLGRSYADVMAMYLDMEAGTPVFFDSAFEKHMGISVAEYQAQFFSRMAAYLPAQ